MSRRLASTLVLPCILGVCLLALGGCGIGLSSAKALTSFGFVTPEVTGTVDESAYTVAVAVPDATDVTALVATFTTTGSEVRVGGTPQVSGVTLNDFTDPVTYTVAAENGDTQDYVVTVEAAPQVPTSFAQKVLIEEATGAWCGYCPDGAYRLQELIDAYSGRVIGVAYHYMDSLAAEEWEEWSDGLGGAPAFPMGAVNRIEVGGTVFQSRGDWGSMAADILAQVAPCGVRIVSTLTGATAHIEVFAGFSETPAVEPRLTVLLTEDDVTGCPQRNYYNDNPTSPFCGRGDPIDDFVHQHVLRCFLTPVFGVAIATENAAAGGCALLTFTYEVPASWATDKLSVVALVNGYGEGAAEDVVLNAQSVLLGSTLEWD